jgi:hypothetical protein
MVDITPMLILHGMAQVKDLSKIIKVPGLSAFHHRDLVAEIMNLKGAKVNFGSWFQRFKPLLAWP